MIQIKHLVVLFLLVQFVVFTCLFQMRMRDVELPRIVSGCAEDRTEVELLRSELDARNFFSETRYLYDKDRERWKASFVRFCEDAVIPQQNEAVAQRLQNTAQSRYGDSHPEYLRERARKGNAVLVVWQTPVYEVLAGDWWHWTNESGGHKGATDVDCDVPCIVTDDTRLAEDADALFFEMGGLFFPKHRRKPEQLWVAIAWEAVSSSTYRLLGNAQGMSVFNYTAAFSQDMDFPTRPIFELTHHSLAPLIPTQERTGLVAFVASNCNTASNRDVYVSELMRHIQVDSYGACLHNTDFPQEVDPDNPVNSRQNNDFAIGKNAVTRRYKFVLVMSNSLCDGFVDEKVEDAFISGAVPVILGSPTVRDYDPGTKYPAMIMIEDFSSAKELAAYLKYLDTNDEEYMRFHEYRQHVVDDESMITLPKGDLSRERTGHECFVCKQVTESKKTKLTHEGKPLGCQGSWKDVIHNPDH